MKTITRIELTTDRRVDIKLSDGTSVALIMSEDGKAKLFCDSPSKVFEMVAGEGFIARADFFGHPHED